MSGEQQNKQKLVDPNLSIDEKIILVDENNNVIGSTTRKEMRKHNYWHRSSSIFAYNSKHQFYIQKRTDIKDYCPGYYDLASGGVMADGETQQLNAKRQLQEQLGIKKEQLQFIGTLKHEDQLSRGFTSVYLTKYDGEVIPQPEEVQAVEMWTSDEMFKKIQAGEKITPDSIKSFKMLWEPLQKTEQPKKNQFYASTLNERANVFKLGAASASHKQQQQYMQQQVIKGVESNEEYQREIKHLNDLVQRLNRELRAYQRKDGLYDLQSLMLHDQYEEDFYQIMNSGLYLSPLLIAYEKIFRNQEQEIADLRVACQESTDHCVSLAQQNQKLHDQIQLKSRELLKTLSEAADSSTYMSNFAAYKQQLDERCALLSEQNQLLLQQVDVMRNQINDYSNTFQQKIQVATQQSQNYESTLMQLQNWKTKYVTTSRNLQILESNYKSVQSELGILKTNKNQQLDGLYKSRRLLNSTLREKQLIQLRANDIQKRYKCEKGMYEQQTDQLIKKIKDKQNEHLRLERELNTHKVQSRSIKERFDNLQKDYEHSMKYNQEFQQQFSDYQRQNDGNEKIVQEYKGKIDQLQLQKEKIKLKEEQFRRNTIKMQNEFKQDMQRKTERFQSLMDGKKKAFEKRIEDLEEKLNDYQMENFSLKDRADRAERDADSKAKMLEQMKRIMKASNSALVQI